MHHSVKVADLLQQKPRYARIEKLELCDSLWSCVEPFGIVEADSALEQRFARLCQRVVFDYICIYICGYDRSAQRQGGAMIHTLLAYPPHTSRLDSSVKDLVSLQWLTWTRHL